jgi:hypothetical protein
LDFLNKLTIKMIGGKTIRFETKPIIICKKQIKLFLWML